MQFNTIFLLIVTASSGVQAAPTLPSEEIVSRAITNITCTHPYELSWWGSYPEGIRDDITYLRTRPGAAILTPLSCTRAACVSMNSAIIICNDRNATTTVQSWKTVAKVSQAVYDQCINFDDPFAFRGQGFDSSGWSVVFRWEYCGV